MSDPPNKLTYAQRQREARKSDLRERIRGAAYLRVLERIAAKADKIESKDVPAQSLKATIYLKLLAKVLPDLKAVEHSGSIGQRDERELTAQELRDIAVRGRSRAIEQDGSQTELPEVH